MNKYITAGLFGLSLLATSVISVGATTLKEAADATYKLYEGEAGVCSMTFIGNDADGAIFLTARHCVVDSKGLNFRIQKLNEKYEVTSEVINYLEVLRQNKDDDTAILQVTEKDVALGIAAVELATPEEAKKIEFGQDLVALGFPAADQKSITKGSFTAKVAGVIDVKEQYQTTVPLAGGNSGGGLYAKFGEEYKLIGTASAKRRDNDIMTYFSTADAVKRVLAGFLNNDNLVSINPDLLPGGLVDEK